MKKKPEDQDLPGSDSGVKRFIENNKPEIKWFFIGLIIAVFIAIVFLL